MPVEHVRKNCFCILTSIFCLPNLFKKAEFKIKGLDRSINTYVDIKPLISETLLDAINSEAFPINLDILLNLLFNWICEDVINAAELTKIFLPIIFRKMTGEWPAEVTKTAIKILSAISRLQDKYEKGHDQANFVVISLCRFIEIKMQQLPVYEKSREELVCAAFDAISDWLMVGKEGQWILHFRETRKELLKSIVLGLTGMAPKRLQLPGDPGSNNPTSGQSNSLISSAGLSSQLEDKGKDKDKKASRKEPKKEPEKKSEKKSAAAAAEINVVAHPEKIREAAHSTLATLLNQTGNFPTASGPQSISTMVTEEQFLTDNIQKAKERGIDFDPVNSKQFLRYFITDDRVIICAIDRPYELQGPSVAIIIRDCTGKYAWDTHLTFLATAEKSKSCVIDPSLVNIPVSNVPFQSSSPPALVLLTEVADAYGFLETLESRQAIAAVRNQLQQEQKYLEKTDFKLSFDTSINIPKGSDPYFGDCKFQQSRILLSHFGFLSLHNRGRLFPCSMTPQFYQALKVLDSAPERESIQISVCYMRKGQTADEEVFGNIGGTFDYQEFISSLGWGVNLSIHSGFKGMLEGKRGGMIAPYWSDYGSEVIFQVSTLLPNSDKHPDHSQKKKILFNSAVNCVIVWTEDHDSFQPSFIWSKSKCNLLIILVSPLPVGLYSIKLFARSDPNNVRHLTVAKKKKRKIRER